jgi:hypothetical protein
MLPDNYLILFAISSCVSSFKLSNGGKRNVESVTKRAQYVVEHSTQLLHVNCTSFILNARGWNLG